MKKILKNIMIYGCIFLLCLINCSSIWAVDTFNFYNFDEVLFQLTTPIKSASSSILSSYLCDCLLIAFLLSVFLFIVIYLLRYYINHHEIKIYIPIRKEKISISKRNAKTVLLLCMVFLSLLVIYFCFDRMLIVDYVRNQLQKSSFIEDHYVSPGNIQITFPDEKRNLIYIYAESMESTFFSEDLGGGNKNNYLSPLQDITANNVSFSDTDLFGGAVMVTGTSWTSGSMVAQTSGLPFKNSFQDVWKKPSMLPHVITLGNILEENGYHQEIMFGSDKDYYVWWGFEDSKLFAYAKEEILSLASYDEPFNFTLLTSNTHTVDGYIEKDCTCPYNTSYENAVYCSSIQIADFIHWIQQQDFYSNTTIVVVGDHVSMQRDFYPESTKRRIYNVFINSAISTDHIHNRNFTSMDFFPTTLASLGVTIEGNRLGLGTNLFSPEKTLMEEVGEEKYQKEISKYSSYYMNTFNK